MFVHYFTYVSRPWAKAREGLLGDPTEWLACMVQDAYEEGEAVRARVGLGRDLKLSTEVIVRVAHPLSDDRRVVVPINVEAVRMTGLFPKLQADLVLEPLGSDTTKFSLTGTYEPPLGSTGSLLDRALLHHVAEAVVKNFVDRIAIELESIADRLAS